jgi:fucose permease
MSDAAAGRLFLAQFLSSTVAAACSGAIGARVGNSRSIAFAYCVMGGALIVLGHVPHWAGVICIAGYGAALGLSIPLVNGLAAASAPGAQVASLNLLNTAWCAGAIFSPPLVIVLIEKLHFGVAIGLIGVLCVAAGLFSFLFIGPAVDGTSPASGRGGADLRHAAILTGLFTFLYVGIENSVNGWLPTLTERLAGGEKVMTAAPVSVFWASILLSRLTAAFAAGRARPANSLLVGLCLAIPGIALLFGFHPVLLVIGAAAAGLGLGPIFPTAIAMFQNRAGDASARLLGLVFAVSGCGGAVTPWLVGVVSSASGNLRFGMLLALASAVVMLLFPKRLEW